MIISRRTRAGFLPSDEIDQPIQRPAQEKRGEQHRLRNRSVGRFVGLSVGRIKMCSSFTRRFACACDVVVNHPCLSSLDGDDGPCTKTDTIVAHLWLCHLCGNPRNTARYPSVCSDVGGAQSEDGSKSSYLEGVPSNRPTALVSTFDWLTSVPSALDPTFTPRHGDSSLGSPVGTASFPSSATSPYSVSPLSSPVETVSSSWSIDFERGSVKEAWRDLREATCRDTFEGEETNRSTSSPGDRREGEFSETECITDRIISEYGSFHEGDVGADEHSKSHIDIIEVAPPGSDSESDVDVIEVAPPGSDSESDVEIIEVAPPESYPESDSFVIEIYPLGQEPDFSSLSPSSPSEVGVFLSKETILLGVFIWFSLSFYFAFWYLLVRS